jgi:hypothetical protein
MLSLRPIGRFDSLPLFVEVSKNRLEVCKNGNRRNLGLSTMQSANATSDVLGGEKLAEYAFVKVNKNLYIVLKAGGRGGYGFVLMKGRVVKHEKLFLGKRVDVQLCGLDGCDFIIRPVFNHPRVLRF